MKVDRKALWNLYHKYFDAYGATTQKTVDALNAILDRFETETRLTNIAQFAYVLATAFHESGINGNHFVPVKEGRERTGAKGRRNQDRYWFTGFYGRGLIQTTWEEKYLALGKMLGVGDMFVKNPDQLLEIGWAYQALVAGMVSGIYRKDEKGRHTLRRHLKSDDASTAGYIEAREIVNGDKKKNGALIGGYAQHFETILNKSKVSTEPEPRGSNQSANVLSAESVEETETSETFSPENALSSVSNQIEDMTEKGENTLGKVEEVIREKVQEGNKETEKITSQVTDTFNPQNLPAFIPRFGKQWLLGLIPGGGLIATISAKLAAMPDWFVFLLGVITGATAFAFIQLAIKYRAGVMEFVTKCYEATANPQMHNLIPTPAGDKVGFFKSYGNRRASLESALEVSPTVERLAAQFRKLPNAERLKFMSENY